MSKRVKLFVIFALLAVATVAAVAMLHSDGRAVLAQDGREGVESSAPLDGLPDKAGVPLNEPVPAGAEAVAAIEDFRISGTALKPRGDDVSYIPTAGGGCFYASSGNSFRVFNAPLSFEQGSRIVAMRMYYDDTSASNSRAWFTVYNLYGDLVEEWSVDSIGNTGNGFNDTDTIDHVIDYLSYSYAVNWRPSDLGSDTQFCGVRFFYEPPSFLTFLPSVVK